MKCHVIALVGLVLVVSSVAAQAQQDAANIGARLMNDAAIKAAIEAIKASEAQTIEDQVRLCEIEAPPFKESKRAEVYAKMFRALGLQNVRIDKAGNVLGDRPGAQPRPRLVFTAHLDTVFPEGTDVKVKREGNILRGPGIGDDCRGLAVLLAVVRTLNQAKIQTPGSITFVGTVGEEGLGDLRGVKYLFNEGMKGQIDRFVSIDGTGLGITHIAVGSLRYRVTFKGPGGHSYGAFGLSNPMHALGRAVNTISQFEVPENPKTTFNVGRIGGGTSVNAIPFDAWFEMDMRSASPSALQALDQKFHRAVDEAVKAEDARWGKNVLSVDKALVGDRPAGQTPANSPIVQAAVSVTKTLGFPVTLDEGSTDSNIAMNLGIPAITIDGGGRGRGSHALDENFDQTNSFQGSQRALLLCIALAQQ
ncbi:MAG TPA: M20/M25/M40 family metallo-hydrolase [Vicinamibacterales bacterium]|nr:M20/M25/M40 family metallo-hydrolase [Vicinamibacterales bacterium]